MGGVPLLVMAAAMGITYGWHPDGRGGVDYVVQIPPSQIDQLRDNGTITSVIDPEVRGHVSRVIVKVGTEPLARITPESIRNERENSVIALTGASTDKTPLPTPELSAGDGQSPRSLVMKPDPQDASRGPGLSLPPTGGGARTARPAGQAGNGFQDAMTELSADLAQQTRNEIRGGANQAKSALSATADRTSEALRNALATPSRSNSQSNALRGSSTTASQNANRQVPPFTGSGSDNVARIRASGPTTAVARDKQWFDMNAKTPQRGPSTDPIDKKTAWPEMAGPPDLRNRQLQTQATRNVANESTRRAVQPLGSTSTFARIPESLNVPNSIQQGNTNAQAMTVSEYQRAQYERQLQQQQPATSATGNLAYPNQERTLGRSIASDNRSSEYDFPSKQITQPSAARSALRDDRAVNVSTNQQAFDSRLSQADVARLPYGAWSRDAYGNPIDRDGRILDQYGRPVSQQRAYELTQERTSTSVSLDRPIQNSIARPTTGINQSGLASRPSLDQTDRIAQRGPLGTVAGDSSRGAFSPSDRSESSLRNDGMRDYSSASGLSKNRQTLAAQPLFNGLLLISIVANVYLIFWLKNLRLQFRDLVAAKRATAAEISS